MSPALNERKKPRRGSSIQVTSIERKKQKQVHHQIRGRSQSEEAANELHQSRGRNKNETIIE